MIAAPEEQFAEIVKRIRVQRISLAEFAPNAFGGIEFVLLLKHQRVGVVVVRHIRRQAATFAASFQGAL